MSNLLNKVLNELGQVTVVAGPVELVCEIANSDWKDYPAHRWNFDSPMGMKWTMAIRGVLAAVEVTRRFALVGVSNRFSPSAMKLSMVDGEKLETVARYLPGNYLALPTGVKDLTLVVGFDDAGWTMHDYVIPRLASGMIHAKEISLDDLKELMS